MPCFVQRCQSLTLSGYLLQEEVHQAQFKEPIPSFEVFYEGNPRDLKIRAHERIIVTFYQSCLGLPVLKLCLYN